MVGADRLFVDVSFIDLLKKIYHVEAFELDGLKINIELLSGNKINLLELIRKIWPNPRPGTGKKSQACCSISQYTLPTVVIDSVVLHQGQVQL